MSTVRITSGLHKNQKLEVPKSAHPMGERERTAIFNSLGDKLQDAHILDIFAGSGALGLESLSRGCATATFVENNREAREIIKKNIKKLGVPTEKTRVLRSLPENTDVNTHTMGKSAESSLDNILPARTTTYILDDTDRFVSLSDGVGAPDDETETVLPDVQGMTSSAETGIGEGTVQRFSAYKAFDIIFADPPYNNPKLEIIQQLPQLLSPTGTLILSLSKATPTPTLPPLTLISQKTYSGAAIYFFVLPTSSH